MLKKISAAVGLIVVGGAVFTASPAFAMPDASRGWHSHHFRHRAHHRHWNANRNRPKIYIRIYIYNKNNNAAVVARQRDRDDGLVPIARRGVGAPALIPQTARRPVGGDVGAGTGIGAPGRRAGDPPQQQG